MYGSEITLLCLQAIDKQIHVIILEHINYVLLVIDNIIVLLKSTFHCLNSLFFFFYSNILTLRQTIRMIGCILVPLYMKKKKTWTVQIKHVQAYKVSVTDIMCAINASTQLV